MADNADLEIIGLGFYVEDLPLGRRFRTIGRTVTESDITAFVGATGMVEVLFTNIEYLRSEAIIKGGRLAPAALVFSFAEGLLMQATMQHTGLAFLGMTMEVKQPVFAGQTLHVVVEVTESRATRTPGRGIVTTRNEVMNNSGEMVLSYTPTRMMKFRHASGK
jgi:acyl dehydratase